MQEVTLNLLAKEVIDIVNVLGQLPTQANAYPLFMKVKSQLEAQLPKSDESKDVIEG
ncbi:hypothetical protein UFOVP239_62 [uncultured Caudovirales phage]|uniref:Uncharacterized protein n=1 Tax=uncultured Caudovirales phage TaxID=2100421 RepID=A0A6J7WYM1_9CAUD|nr:hypothetical protein UFOVP239_62 [uncultured Caudovirales phage]